MQISGWRGGDRSPPQHSGPLLSYLPRVLHQPHRAGGDRRCGQGRRLLYRVGEGDAAVSLQWTDGLAGSRPSRDRALPTGRQVSADGSQEVRGGAPLDTLAVNNVAFLLSLAE